MTLPVTQSLRSIRVDIRAGRLSPLDLVRMMLTRIDELNDRVHAYITVAKDSALEAARKATGNASASQAGPLNGIPYACKDLFLSKGIQTSAGSRVLEGWVPDCNAAVVERLASAGAIMLGKANMHEFAHGVTGENPHFGTPPNPWDRTRLAGGSSSGSVVAVAHGLACFAMGSDTGGSVRVPAALCGVVGLKPTYGLVSFHGAVPYSWSLDHPGIIAARVEDVAEVLQAIAGYDPRDPVSVSAVVPDYGAALRDDACGLRVGVPSGPYFSRADAEIVAAAERALSSLTQVGVRATELELPPMDRARTVSLLVQMPEALSYHRRHLKEKAALYGEDVRAGLAFGQFVLAEHYVTARRMIERYRRAMDAVFQEVDAILTPTCPIVAPPIGTGTVLIDGEVVPVGNALTRFTGFFNMTGHPAISVPIALHSNGLPIGLQLVGRPFNEATILRLAYLLEQRRDVQLYQ